ncbi:PadR family transcriptional regulator [Streptomyces sodiiphilus]|uniref:PadR family transcriptional regulator n=1 Tax=Streptomyces sodiiphilus TaxID=226217 RepID=A0ABP5A5I8_9ACTN
MPPVFGHGRLRLYLLKLLSEAPRHGYEVIRLLEERFQGLYAPSAGTVYPRLAKLEAEGLVTHAVEGGRKVYSLTAAGQAELAGRAEELAGLEREIRDSLAALAAGIREDVSGSARDLREEMRQAAERTRGTGRAAGGGTGNKTAWQEEARRAKEESRRARQEARQAREAHKQAKEAARDHFEQAARRIQERVRSHVSAGDWQAAVREGLEGLTHEVGGWSRLMEETVGASAPSEPADVPDPARELERLLDSFRDGVRDAARDNGVTQEQLREARRELSAVAARLGVLLRPPRG